MSVEDEEYTERLQEVRDELGELLVFAGFQAEKYRLENDIWVAGSLHDLMEFCQENRSEIEELG